MLSLEQQHLFDNLQVIARLTCEICFESEDLPLVFLDPAEQSANYHSESFQRAVKTFNQTWRVLPYPAQLSAYHKKKQALSRTINELPEDRSLSSTPGLPVVLCKDCAEVLEQQL